MLKAHVNKEGWIRDYDKAVVTNIHYTNDLNEAQEFELKSQVKYAVRAMGKKMENVLIIGEEETTVIIVR